MTTAADVPATKRSDSSVDRPTTLALLMLLALALRLGWWLAYVMSIDNEGVVYARLAQGLVGGDGLVGIFGGRDIMFPPGFPALIAAVSLLTGDAEAAGRVVSLASGVALVAVIYSIAQRLGAHRAGVIAGLLVAVHPLMIALSVSLYSEMTWMFLMFLAAALVMRGLQRDAGYELLWAGLALGVAYLVRPETLVFAAVLIASYAVLALWQRTPVERLLRRTALFVLVTAALTVPYIAYLSGLSGGFRWEGKSTYNNELSERIESGMTYAQAARGLDSQGNASGVFLRLHEDQRTRLKEEAGSLGKLAATVLSDLPGRVTVLLRQFAGARFLGVPWIAVLAALGFVASRWWRASLQPGLVLLVVMALQGLLLLSLHFTWSRYFFPLFPGLAVWCGVGIERFASRVGAFRFVSGPRLSGAAYWSISIGLVLFIAAASVTAVRGVGELNEMEDTVPRQIGAAIARDARQISLVRRPIVMGFGLAPVFYAGGQMRYLPHAEAGQALAYVRRTAPDYIVVREYEAFQAPYVQDWLKNNPAPECATPLDLALTGARESVKIWRWRCPA